MYTDTVSDFVTRIRNASAAGRDSLIVRNSKVVTSLADILKKEGFVKSVKADGRQLTLELNNESPVSHIERLSRPGLRRYVRSTEIPQTKSGFGTVIISTPKGVLTANQAKKQKVGGELICEVW